MLSDVEIGAFNARRARLILGLTQAEMAIKMDVDQATISRWERGKQKPGPEHWIMLDEICSGQQPALSQKYIELSPIPKVLIALNSDFHRLALSKGAIELFEKHGYTAQDWLEANEGRTDRFTPRLMPIFQDPRFQRGEIAFIEAKGTSWLGERHTPIHMHIFVAPVLDAGVIIVEGVEQKGETEHWAKLYFADGHEEICC